MKNLTNKDRVIIVSEITEESFPVFAAELLACATGMKSTPVKVIINSHGGSPYAAIAYSDLIGRVDVCVHTICMGRAMSAAVLVLASGDKRFMTANSWVMVHENIIKDKGSTSEVEKEVKQNLAEEKHWSEMLSTLTGMPANGWRQLHKDTTYITAQKCLDLGLVDEII